MVDEENISELPFSGARDKGNFFGPSPAELADLAATIRSESGEDSGAYATALITLGNSHCIAGGDELTEALAAYEQALRIFESLEPSGLESADAHHRIGAVFRRVGQHALSAQHIQKALDIFERAKAEIDPDYLQRLRGELKELQTFCVNMHSPGSAGGPPV